MSVQLAGRIYETASSFSSSCSDDYEPLSDEIGIRIFWGVLKLKCAVSLDFA
jgi:hypothetical protein